MSSALITKNISFDAPRSYSFNILPNSRYEVEVGVEPAHPCQGTVQLKWAVPMTGTCITPASGKWFRNFLLSIFDCDCMLPSLSKIFGTPLLGPISLFHEIIGLSLLLNG